MAGRRARLPEAVELLYLLAFFGPGPVPRDVFPRGSLAVARLGDLLGDPIRLARAIRELGRYALIRIDGRAIVIHRLVQAMLRDGLSPEEQDRYRHEVHLILAADAPGDPDDQRLWSRYRELLPHVMAPEAELVRCQDPAVRDLALRAMRYLNLSGEAASCRSFAESSITQWTADSGPDDPSVIAAQRHLGDALRQLGRYSEARQVRG